MQTVSLELSKELWEKGLRIETEKWWYHSTMNAEDSEDKFWVCDHKEKIGRFILKISAPSTDELLAVMPVDIVVHKKDTVFIVSYKEIKQGKWDYIANEFDISPSETLGKMCLWLLSNDYHYNPGTKMIEND